MTVTNDQIKKALYDHYGIVSQAARSLGRTRDALAKRIKKNPSLQEALKQARERLIDKGESALVAAIDRGEPWAISLALKTLGKHRGYTEKQEYEHIGELTITWKK
jgi:hypothetical protein